MCVYRSPHINRLCIFQRIDVGFKACVWTTLTRGRAWGVQSYKCVGKMHDTDRLCIFQRNETGFKASPWTTLKGASYSHAREVQYTSPVTKQIGPFSVSKSTRVREMQSCALCREPAFFVLLQNQSFLDVPFGDTFSVSDSADTFSAIDCESLSQAFLAILGHSQRRMLSVRRIARVFVFVFVCVFVCLCMYAGLCVRCGCRLPAVKQVNVTFERCSNMLFLPTNTHTCTLAQFHSHVCVIRPDASFHAGPPVRPLRVPAHQ